MSRDPKSFDNDNGKAEKKSAQDLAFERELTELADTLSDGNPQEAPVNSRELFSLQALIAYMAYQKGVQEELVQSLVEMRFKVKNIEEIASRNFEEAVRYLVDLDPRANIN